MILVATLSAAAFAIVVSELLGRGRVVYTRVLALILSYAGGCLLADGMVDLYGGGLFDDVAIPLSVVPFMAAWLGFRIHLSNSVTLEMASLLEQRGPQSSEELIRAYDPSGHTATRLQILREAGYFVGDNDSLADTGKGRAVLRLIHLLCGPAGPRAVVAMLGRRGAGAP